MAALARAGEGAPRRSSGRGAEVEDQYVPGQANNFGITCRDLAGTAAAAARWVILSPLPSPRPSGGENALRAARRKNL